MKLLPYYVNSLVITSLLQKHCLGLRFYYQWWNASVEVSILSGQQFKNVILWLPVFAIGVQVVCLSCESMASYQESQSSGQSRWKQLWRRSPNTCCSKRILLLLVWQALFTFSHGVLMYTAPAYMINGIVLYPSIFLSYSFAPFIGWLADVGFGRYEVIKFGSIASFLASLLYYFAMFAGESASTLSTVLYSIAFVIVSFLFISYAAAMLPFLTDQIIGATSDELSAVVRWYMWMPYLGLCLSDFIAHFGTLGNFEKCFCFCCSSCCDHHQWLLVSAVVGQDS